MAWCDASSSISDDEDGEVGDNDNDDGGDDDDDDDEDGSKVIYVQHAKYFIRPRCSHKRRLIGIVLESTRKGCMSMCHILLRF